MPQLINVFCYETYALHVGGVRRAMASLDLVNEYPIVVEHCIWDCGGIASAPAAGAEHSDIY